MTKVSMKFIHLVEDMIFACLFEFMRASILYQLVFVANFEMLFCYLRKVEFQ